MTEPDEALICARRWRCKNLQDLGFPPSLVQSVSEGSTDETLQSFAHGYRAGQAASAERIKTLEEALRPLAECEIIEPDVPIPDDYGARYFITYGEIRRARALLEEADQ